MVKDVDAKFYDRADGHINLSNDQAEQIDKGKVSASMMYGTARFNVWVRASECDSGGELVGERQEIIDYFVKQYRLMLEEHLDAISSTSTST